MSNEPSLPDFDDLADMYWRLGVMQSPSQLHGFLVGQLAAGGELTLAQWCAQAVRYAECVDAPTAAENSLLEQLYTATSAGLHSGDMDLQLLLPDDAVEIVQRIDALGQWGQGFMAGFAHAGKAIQKTRGQQHYSQDVTEALNDMASITQVSIAEDDREPEQWEQDLFAIAEYLRLLAVTIYLECNQQVAAAQPSLPVAGSPRMATASPANLFAPKPPRNKLH